MGEPDVGETGERRRLWRRPGTVITVVVVVLAVGLAGLIVHNITKDRLAAGTVRPGEVALSGPVVSNTLPMAMPNAQLNVQVSVGGSGTVDDDKVRAPRGGVLVEIVWSSTESSALTDPPSPAGGLPGDGPSTLAVRSPGKTVMVDRRLRPGTREQEAVAALPGDADQVEVVAGFAGRSQTVAVSSGQRSAGAFASLYRTEAWPFGSNPAVSIERKQPKDPRSHFEWRAEVKQGQRAVRRPYLEGLGWAARGKEWLVVSDVGYYLNDDAAQWRSVDDEVDYEVDHKDGDKDGTGPSLTVSVAGHGPVKVLRQPGESRKSYGYSAPANGAYVFAIRSGDAATVNSVLRVKLRRSESGDDGTVGRAPATSSMVVSRRDVRPAVGEPAR
ncbi:hypothetical protein [Flexivirga sp. B27]